MIIIKNFIGRLGNNIIQLSNIIDVALYYKHNIIFQVKHNLFNLKIISDYFCKYNNNKIIHAGWNFFDRSKLSYPKEIFEINNEKRNRILKESFLIKNIEKLNENYLVIHIRSGDIFSSNPHPGYVPPPVSYYTKEINKHAYEKIIIVCEDKINPVVNKLLEMYKNLCIKKNNLEEDIRLLLGSKNIIFSVGTFVTSLMKMSDNIEYLFGSNANIKELEVYYKIMKPWKNTKKQRNYILSYKL